MSFQSQDQRARQELDRGAALAAHFTSRSLSSESVSLRAAGQESVVPRCVP